MPLGFQILGYPRLDFRDRKLSGLYQSFTYVFDIRLVSGDSTRKWYTRDVCQRRIAVLEIISPSFLIDVSVCVISDYREGKTRQKRRERKGQGKGGKMENFGWRCNF